MPRLEMDVTDKMMKKLQERANTYATRPSDIAKWILACELAKAEKPQWADRLTELIRRLSEAVIAISKIDVPKK